MSTWDLGDGIFKSYLMNISTEHSLYTTTKGLLHSVWWYLITRSGNWSLKKYYVSFLCDLCHNINHKVVFRPAIISPDYSRNSNVKIWVWARIVKGADLSVSTSQWSSHMSQCLRNNWVTRGMHTLVYFTAQTPSRMHKTPPDVTLAAAWNNLNIIETVVIKLNTLDKPGYINKIVADMRQAITNYQADLNMVMMVPQISCYVQPLNKECSRDVSTSTTRWFLWYQRVRFLTTIKRYVILMICHWKLAKIQDWKLYENLFRVSQTFMEITILFVGKWNDTACLQDKKAIFMMTSSNGNIFRVTGPLCGEFTGPGEFPTQRPVTRSFDVFFDLRLNKRLSKQPWGWWFETRSWSLWRQCNVYFMSVTSTNNISFQKSYCPTETKTIWDTKGEGNKTYKTNLVIKK